jgi:hypothetical protein
MAAAGLIAIASRPWRGGGGAIGARRRTLASAAARTAETISWPDSTRNCFSPRRGLVTMLTAPDDSACIAVAVPASVSEEQMITGVGRSAMIFFRKVMPSMRGISTSSTTTSGQLRFILSSANRGSAATPITSMPGAADRMPERIWRTVAESSTTRTRMAFMTRVRLRRPARACASPTRARSRCRK